MRVQELGPAPCSKMSSRPMNGDLSGIKQESNREEANGSTSPRVVNTETDNGNSISGGRLKFFKDGKFILELSHRKEGERTCWIPVPKKTFWPAVGTPKQECSTSLSVSDDNSSVQSSPWQRDHCWKQSAPVRHAGRGLEFVMVARRRTQRSKYAPKSVRRKRRRPFDAGPVDSAVAERPTAARPAAPQTVVGINAVVQNLWERVIRADPGIVSPRKRILREMERVTLEDQNHQSASKRQRPPRPNHNHQPPVAGVTANHALQPAAAPELTHTPTAKPQRSSHSITAILAPREDETSFLRNLLRSSPTAEPLPPAAAAPLHPIYPYPHAPSPSYAHHHYYPAPAPAHPHSSYRGAPAVWSMPRYPLADPRASYPLSSYHPPASPHHAPTSWSPYQPIDLKREDCVSDVPLNLSKDAG